MGCSQPFPSLSFYYIPSLFHRLFLVWSSPDSLPLFCSLRLSFSTHDWKANGTAGPQCDHRGKLVSACAGVIVAGVEYTLDNQVHNKALSLRTVSRSQLDLTRVQRKSGIKQQVHFPSGALENMQRSFPVEISQPCVREGMFTAEGEKALHGEVRQKSQNQFLRQH